MNLIVNADNQRKLLLKLGENKCDVCKKTLQNNSFVYYCDVKKRVFCEICGKEVGEVRRSKVWVCLSYLHPSSSHSHPLVTIQLEAKS